MEQLEDFKLPGKEKKVWWLCKALYDFKQAGLFWWYMIIKSILVLGFNNVNPILMYIFIVIKRLDVITQNP